MSGLLSPGKGKNSQHFQAARDWLDRAESQIESGMDIMAASTLMLAQAELRLAVESIASGTSVAEPEFQPKLVRFPNVSRILLGGVAVAACLVLGLMIGRMTVPAPGTSTVQTPVQIVQAEHVENQPELIPPGLEPDEFIESISETTAQPTGNGLEAIAGATLSPTGEEITEMPVEVAAPPTTPVNVPRQPSRTNAQVNIDLPPAETPSETVSLPSSDEAGGEVVGVMPGEHGATPDKISSAEVALRTILALSDRFLEGRESVDEP